MLLILESAVIVRCENHTRCFTNHSYYYYKFNQKIKKISEKFETRSDAIFRFSHKPPLYRVSIYLVYSVNLPTSFSRVQWSKIIVYCQEILIPGKLYEINHEEVGKKLL